MDVQKSNIENLEAEIKALLQGGAMLPRIQFSNIQVGLDFSQQIKIATNIPVLSFVDPWGYKGLTMELIRTLIKNNGSECIFFFNYNRINMALSSNKLFDEHLEGIFGAEAASKLKSEL